jgi:hypothetical protein
MMPLAYAGLISGMLTLVATAPNMVPGIGYPGPKGSPSSSQARNNRIHTTEIAAP